MATLILTGRPTPAKLKFLRIVARHLDAGILKARQHDDGTLHVLYIRLAEPQARAAGILTEGSFYIGSPWEWAMVVEARINDLLAEQDLGMLSRDEPVHDCGDEFVPLQPDNDPNLTYFVRRRDDYSWRLA